MYRATNHTEHVSGPNVDRLLIKAVAIQAKRLAIKQLWIYNKHDRLIFSPIELEHLTLGFVCTILVNTILAGLDDQVWDNIDDTIATLRIHHHSN